MANQTFNPISKTIRKLFSDDDSWYRVPLYQRPYRWQGKDISNLWNDLWDAFEKQESSELKSYFLGAIIASAPRAKDRYFDIIDGQQRLTSLTILFAVFRDLYPKINEDSQDGEAIMLSNLHRAIDDNKTPRLVIDTRLVPDESAAADFRKYVSKHNATLETKDAPRPTKDQLNGDNPKYNYILAVQTFVEKLKDKSPEKVANFINYVFNHVHFIRIDCANAYFAMEMFQVINTRGMDLSPSDLIKSYLLIKIRSMTDDDSTIERQSREFIAAWRQAEKDAQESKSNLDEMLILYYYYDRVQSPGRDIHLYKKLRDLFNEKTESPIDIIEDISRFVNYYKNDIHKSKEKAVLALTYNRWKGLWKSVLLSAKQKGYDEYGELANQMRRFYYLHWIAGNDMSAVKEISFDIIKKIKNGEAIGEIKKTLTAHLEDKKVIPKALANLNSTEAAKAIWCKPLLLSLDYILTDRVAALVESGKKNHLEHILPQKFKGKEGWENIPAEGAKLYLNSLGNLTLLSGAKNTPASNKPFEVKLAYYEGKVGNSPGTSEFELTQQIIKSGVKKWGISEMEERRVWIMGEIAKLLGIQKEEMETFLKENKTPADPQ